MALYSCGMSQRDITEQAMRDIAFPHEALQRELEGRVASGKLEPESLELVEETLHRTAYAETYNDKELQDIIYDLGQVYLSEDRSLEDTVAQIQSRAKIYVAERYN